MPARNPYHGQLKNALTKEGWIITHDPFRIGEDGVTLLLDLAAECRSGSGAASQRIAVIIYSDEDPQSLTALANARGRYMVCQAYLAAEEPERVLYLAVPEDAWQGIFATSLGRLALERHDMPVLVFSAQDEAIREWLTR